MLLARLGRPRLNVLAYIGVAAFLLLIIHQLELITPSSFRSAFSSAPIKPIYIDPSTVDYTAAVVYLVERRRMNDIPHSLGEMQRNIPWVKQWPIILFHTGEYDGQEAREEFWERITVDMFTLDVYEQLRERIEWVKLEFSLPEGVPEDKSVYKPQVSEEKWPGYQHMCRFYAQQIFFHPRLSNLTYYMRLDTDSFIFNPFCYDPIHRMHQHRVSYTYNRITPDEGYVVRGMWNLIDSYARSHPEVEERLKHNMWPWPAGRETWAEKGITYDGIGVPAYSNNFEIVRIEAFQRKDIVEWTDEIMKDPDRIYSLRWGDAPIRGATMSMFFDLDKDVEKICAMNYWHQGEVQTSCKCNPYP